MAIVKKSRDELLAEQDDIFTRQREERDTLTPEEYRALTDRVIEIDRILYPRTEEDRHRAAIANIEREQEDLFY